MKWSAIYLILICSATILLSNCREPFEPDSINFLDALVVESTITNELKHHEVKLSRTYELGNFEQIFEDNANVRVEDSNNNIYNFSLSGNGIYVSDNQFQDIEGVTYTLNITTQDGKEYRSSNVAMTAISDITTLYAEIETRDNGDQGIQVMVDNINTTSEAKYFRYEFEETYKVIAPNWNLFEAVITNYSVASNGDSVEFDTEFVERTQEEEICFISESSVGILQTSTNDLNENSIERFPIKFIELEARYLRDRYSILVKQYVQSLEAYTFYDIINQLGENESILSQTQPGYVLGNVTSLNNIEEKVIGFFEVSSVSEKRIFFNYADFNLPKPEYVYDCELLELDYTINATCGPCSPPIRNERREIYRLLTTFQEENYNYLITEVPLNINGIWKLTNPECGDCTTIGTNVEPEFWED
ncbi:DUF4249 domain-containing protein [Bizionia echini]|uniref:DUF4249 domain-containing protein n=1 Tax=Bizionia echini TaxID=649333 RepID=UPI0030DA150A